MGDDATDAARVLEFVHAAKAKGADDATISLMLRDQGWSDRRVQAAFVAVAQERLGIAAPARGGRSESAREAFFYLLSFALLATWSVGLIWLSDILIDHAIPDPLSSIPADLRGQIAGQLASVLVAFPLFLWVNMLLNREIAARPETLDSGVRKWLTYIALAVTAGCLVGDATTFLAAFLGGGLTASFVYKALFLLILSGGIFAYYLQTIRTTATTANANRLFAAAATLGVAFWVGTAFMAGGSPAHQRRLNADDQRVAALAEIASAIYTSTASHAAPASLAELHIDAVHLRDPITSQPYRYRRDGTGTYELCATFDDPSIDSEVPTGWSHPAGSWCYHISSRSGNPKR